MSDIMAKHIEEILERENSIHQYRSTPPISGRFSVRLGATGIIAVASTYEFNLFPPMSYAIEEMGTRRYRAGLVYTGSSGWSGGGRHFEEIIERKKMNWDLVEGYEFRAFLRMKTRKSQKRVLEVVQKIKARFDQ